jgi:MFS family permease
MVFMTVGEMVLIPTSSTMAANLAPADMRGRYMSIYSLSWGIAYGLGPIFAGQLNDRIAPSAMWVGSLAVGLVATVFFLLLARRKEPVPVASVVAE